MIHTLYAVLIAMLLGFPLIALENMPSMKSASDLVMLVPTDGMVPAEQFVVTATAVTLVRITEERNSIEPTPLTTEAQGHTDLRSIERSPGNASNNPLQNQFKS